MGDDEWKVFDPVRVEASPQSVMLELEPVLVEAVEGPSVGSRAVLESGVLVVGSSRRADLSLADPSVARQHLAVELLRGAVRVRTLGGRSRLSVLGTEVESAQLPLGATVTLGHTTIRFRPFEPGERREVVDVAGVVARSLEMRQLLRRLRRVAATEVGAVIWGGRGVGKGVIARALHSLSARAGGPLVFLDCAGSFQASTWIGGNPVPPPELKRANGGTLVLDHFEQLSPLGQGVLKHVLERRSVQFDGAVGPLPIDVRVVALCDAPPENAAAAGQLDQALYYLLAEVVLEVPPLSRRFEDLPELLAAFAQPWVPPPVRFSPRTVSALRALPWKGNVSELKALVEQCASLAARGPAMTAGLSSRERAERALRGDFLRLLLQRNLGSIAAAAREAKVSRGRLSALLRRHHIARNSR